MAHRDLMRTNLAPFALALSLAVTAPVLEGQDRSQSRSMVMSPRGIVASESVLASQVGASILERGGNAIDAAVATNAMMGLIAPMNDGVGGDLFAIVYEAKTGKLYGLNASGWAPTGLSADFLLGKGVSQMPQNGIHSVTVPGAVDGWDKLLTKFGRMKFADVLAPAIAHAEEGFAVGEVVGAFWHDSEQALRADAPTAKTYLIDGRAPAAGEIFKNPDLAWTYRQISSGGADAFYKGEIARKILATSAAHGGTMTATDLGTFASEWVDPISTTYRGWTVYELPPNGQGIAALEMLNIMEGFPLKDYGHNSVRALHAMIEAKKLAYADMHRYDADPRFAKIPVVYAFHTLNLRTAGLCPNDRQRQTDHHRPGACPESLENPGNSTLSATRQRRRLQRRLQGAAHLWSVRAAVSVPGHRADLSARGRTRAQRRCRTAQPLVEPRLLRQAPFPFARPCGSRQSGLCPLVHDPVCAAQARRADPGPSAASRTPAALDATPDRQPCPASCQSRPDRSISFARSRPMGPSRCSTRPGPSTNVWPGNTFGRQSPPTRDGWTSGINVRRSRLGDGASPSPMTCPKRWRGSSPNSRMPDPSITVHDVLDLFRATAPTQKCSRCLGP